MKKVKKKSGSDAREEGVGEAQKEKKS